MNPELETNDQESLSAEEQAQMNEMETADKAGATDPAPAAAAPGPKKKAPAAKADAPAPKAGEQPVEGAEGAEGEGEKPNKGKGAPLSPEALAAVREERAEKKELREALAAAQANNTKLMERFETVLKTFSPKEEAVKEVPLPNRDEDPVGYIEAVMKKTGESLEQVTKRLDASDAEKAQAKERSEGEQVVHSIITQATAKEKEFLAETPDYWDASKFLLKSRHEELEEMGYTEAQRNAIIMQEKVSIAGQALAQGKNPAAVVYGIAKRRGYVAKATADGEGDAEAAVVETPEQKAAAAATKLKALGEGQDASASLSQLGGKGPSNLTAARLLEMTDAEFAAAMQTKEGRALMGS